jgi:hypothetical protein
MTKVVGCGDDEVGACGDGIPPFEEEGRIKMSFSHE